MHDSHRRCEFVGCTKWPLYAFEGEKAKYCSQHKDEGMVDVRSRRCQEPSCTRQPSFGFEHQKPRFCAAHKDEGMVDVVSRRCEEAECRRRPLYGHEGEKGRFCSYHKTEGMVDVVNKRCQQVGCKKRPVFGFEGEKGRFCSLHRAGGMVDVVSRRCDSPGCKRQPSGTTDTTQVQFCSLHRGDGRAGYTLLMMAQRERNAAAAALAETQAQQRARAPMGGPWTGDDMALADYRPQWEAAGSSGGSTGSGSFSSIRPTPGLSGAAFASSSSGSFLGSSRPSSSGLASESFLSQRRSGSAASLQGDQGSSSQPSSPQHDPHKWLWTAQPRGSSQGARRPPPLKNPAEAGVLGIAGRPLDSAGAASPADEWTGTKPASAQSVYPAVKRHCSPRRRSFSHSPEPGARTMMGLTGSMANLQASSPASPSIGPGTASSLGASGTPSPSAMGISGISTPPGSSGSAALPPPHGAPRRNAQRLPQPQYQNRGVPRSSGGPPRPPRSLSPGGVTTSKSQDGFYALSGSGRSPVSNVGFSPSGPTASPGGFSGVFSPGSGLGSAVSGGLNSARSSVSSSGPSPRWASPRNRTVGHTRARSHGSVSDTLEDLSIVDPGPPTLEPLRVFPSGGPLRSPRDRWRGGMPERRNSEIILPLPDRTHPDPLPGPSSDGRRRSFTASLFEQPPVGKQEPVEANSGDAMDTVEGGDSTASTIASNAAGGNSSEISVACAEQQSNAVDNGGTNSNARWGGGDWGASREGTGFQVMSDGYRQQSWHQSLQGSANDDIVGSTHVEAKTARRGSHVSVGTMPLTAESMADRDGTMFFSGET